MDKINGYRFKTANDWSVCTTVPGTREVVVCSDGRISHLTTARGRSLILAEAEDWIYDRPKAKAALHEWLVARNDAVHAWKHETPHQRYCCDGGCLAVRINGARLLVGNGHGDGDFPVYMLEDRHVFNANAESPDVLPGTFVFTGVSVESCSLEVLDYDCDAGADVHVLHACDVKSASFYRDGFGAIAIKYTPMEAK